MKIRLLFVLLLATGFSFSQSLNSFKAVIIPVRYGFQSQDNQYRMQTLTKVGLTKAGFISFYTNQEIPAEYSERCSVLYLDVVKESGFMTTKLSLVFKDCYGKIIHKSVTGTSREKEFDVAYKEAIENAFVSISALNYKYNASNLSSNTPVVPQSSTVTSTDKVLDSKILYAQATAYGYQLIDDVPKVVFKIYKTANPESYIAKKDQLQGVLVKKESAWFFEYYQNDQLVSELVVVKF